MSSLAHSVFSALVVLLVCLLSLTLSYPNCPVLGLLLIMLNSETLKLMVSVCHTNKPLCITFVIHSMPCLKGKTRALIASSNAAVGSETGCFLLRTTTNLF